jgi:hypothetical protein
MIANVFFLFFNLAIFGVIFWAWKRRIPSSRKRFGIVGNLKNA